MSEEQEKKEENPKVEVPQEDSPKEEISQIEEPKEDSPKEDVSPEKSDQEVAPAEVKPEEAEQKQASPDVEQPQEEIPQENPPREDEPKSDEPQVIIQKERGFTYYVGFALLVVVGFILFFVPGMAITFGVNKLVALPCAAAWIFTAILSIALWVIFKVKIKGFKKSFYWYIGLCVLIAVAFVAIDLAVQGHGLKALFDMMVGNVPDVAQAVPAAAPVTPAPVANP